MIAVRIQRVSQLPAAALHEPDPGVRPPEARRPPPDDPIAGWERFFTDRDQYVKNEPDARSSSFPRRGFYSCYPVKEVKPGARCWPRWPVVETASRAVPWLVTNNPAAAWRTASGVRRDVPDGVRAEQRQGREYFERFWGKLMKYMAAKRNMKAPRGRVLVSKEYISGTPIRVQAQILNESAKPYKLGEKEPKFKIVQVARSGGEKHEFGPPIVGAGIGRWQIRRLAERMERRFVDFADIIPANDAVRSEASSAAPAAAVALLARCQL